jgi:EAL domain-containing protein (putative c-di-GMP-specific phosphodiesterase class I)
MTDPIYLRRFPAGHVLFAPNQDADAAYIIEQGSVEIYVEGPGGRERLSLLGPGEIFGEMALVDDSPRSAGACALDDVVCVTVARVQILRAFADSAPLIQMLLRTLIHRLRKATSGGPMGATHLRPEATAAAIARIRHEHEVRVALAAGEIGAFLQPIVRLDDGVPIGFEALARWHHPQFGTLGPEAFLPAVTLAGLLETLDLVVLREGARMVGALNRRLALDGRRPIFLSANFGAAHFADMRLPDTLATILAEAELPPERLKIEITETTLISNAHAAEALARVKAMGVSISLDDFGTGYSGLSYLCRFPIDLLKIDRSFTLAAASERKTAEILRSMLALGAQLEIDAIAEGVESAEQAEMLRAMGCRYGQGYLYGHPLPADQACAALFDRR